MVVPRWKLRERPQLDRRERQLLRERVLQVLLTQGDCACQLLSLPHSMAMTRRFWRCWRSRAFVFAQSRPEETRIRGTWACKLHPLDAVMMTLLRCWVVEHFCPLRLELVKLGSVPLVLSDSLPMATQNPAARQIPLDLASL